MFVDTPQNKAYGLVKRLVYTGNRVMIHSETNPVSTRAERPLTEEDVTTP